MFRQKICQTGRSFFTAVPSENPVTQEEDLRVSELLHEMEYELDLAERRKPKKKIINKNKNNGRGNTQKRNFPLAMYPWQLTTESEDSLSLCSLGTGRAKNTTKQKNQTNKQTNKQTKNITYQSRRQFT